MRVLILIHNSAGLSGSYSRAVGLARGLARVGHDVTLITASRSPSLLPRVHHVEGVNLIESPDLAPARWRHGGLGIWDVLVRLNLVSGGSFDLVHGFEHRPTVVLPSLFLRRRWQIPFVSDWADLWGDEGIISERTWLGRSTIGIYDSIMEERTHLQATALSVVTQALGFRAIQKGFPPERVLRVFPGVDPGLVKSLEKSEARRRFEVSQEAKVIGYMGVSDYDDDLAGRAFAALARAAPKVMLLSIGPVKPKMLSVIKEAGLENQVRDLGVVLHENLGAALSCADVLILPFSDRPINRPRFPSRFGEYLASGRPIVANSTGDLGDVISSEGVGLAVSDRAESMADNIGMLLDDAELAEQMGRRARHLAEGPFSWDSLARSLEGLYHIAIDTQSSKLSHG
jgi:glycosyltransferase involved in cell wall biosynthesis